MAANAAGAGVNCRALVKEVCGRRGAKVTGLKSGYYTRRVRRRTLGRLLRRGERGLGEAPYELRLAREGREALKAMAGETIDIVITDWELPDTTGPELCRKIRSKFGAAPYIVMLTSHADDARVAEALAAGAD